MSQARDHVCIEPNSGAAAESLLFSTMGLSLTHLPRFGVEKGTFSERYAEITLAVRVEADGWDVHAMNMLHPLGGERRLVHWQARTKDGARHCGSARQLVANGSNRSGKRANGAGYIRHLQARLAALTGSTRKHSKAHRRGVR